jgi:Mg-chelatase subunit ChlD
VDAVSEPQSIAWKISDEKLIGALWELKLDAAPNVPYQVQIRRKGYSSLTAQTDDNSHLSIKNLRPASDDIELIVRPLTERTSPVAISMLPMLEVAEFTEEEQAKFTPLVLDKTMRGHLSYMVTRNKVESDSWQIDLSQMTSTTDVMPQLQVSIFADDPADHLSATLVQTKGSDKIVEVERQAEIALDALALSPDIYTLTIGSNDVGVGYSIQAKFSTDSSTSQDQEPNNSKETANPISPQKPVKGRLSELDQEDYFVIDTSASGEAQMWRILATGQGINTLSVDDKFTALSNPKAPDRPVTFRQLQLLPGKHYIKAEGTGDYTLRAIPLGPPNDGFEVEPNDGKYGPMQSLLPGKAVMGSVEQIRYGDNLDQDKYSFTVTGQGTYKITVTPPNDQGIHVQLKMYDSVWFDADLETDAATPLTYESVLFPADYTLEIANIRDRSALDEYSVLLEALPNDSASQAGRDAEPNDRLGFASRIATSTTINGTLGNFDHVDNFLLPVSDQVISVNVETNGKDAGLTTMLLNAQGRQLGLAKKDSHAWEIEPQESDVYFVLERSVTDGISTNDRIDYRMRVTIVPRAVALQTHVQGLKEPPEALQKKMNIGWSGLGAQWESTGKDDAPSQADQQTIESLGSLIDNVMPHGLGANLPSIVSSTRFRLRLAGQEPVPISGFAINTRMLDHPEYKIRRFDFLVSIDGETFDHVLSGELDSSHDTQYFPFTTPVVARYVRFVPTHTFTGNLTPRYAKAQELLVFSADTMASANRDLASQPLGGHVVYETLTQTKKPISPLEIELIDATPAGAKKGTPLCKLPAKQNQAEWVVGFHHNRAARIDTVSYIPSAGHEGASHFKTLTVQTSEQSLLGPWTTIGVWSEQDLAQNQTLTLSGTPWVRFIRLVAEGEANTAYHCPGDLIVLEQPNSNSYLSILAEWDAHSSQGPFEASKDIVDTNYPPVGGAVKDDSREIGKGQQIKSSVKRERNEDWFLIRRGADKSANSAVLQLSHPASFKPTMTVVDEDENQLQLQEVVEDDGTISDISQSPVLPLGWNQTKYRFWLTDSSTYRLRVQEPLRNTVIAWDGSSSMADVLPYIHSSIQNWSTYIAPDHEQVKIMTLESEAYPENSWANHPYMLQAALELARTNPSGSSNVETALLRASKLLAQQTGNHAIVLTSDGISPKNVNLWSSFKQVCPQVYAAGIGGGASAIAGFSDSDFGRWQDNFQNWIGACGGQYRYCDNFKCLEEFYEFAANDIRKPKPYLLLVEQSYIKPADPGSISVALGRSSLKETNKALYVILDASGSMLARIEGKSRIDIAKSTLKNIVSSSIGEQNHFALRTFGLKSNECHHELTVPLRKLNITRAEAAIEGIRAINLAKTPIADSLVAAAEDLKGFDSEKLIILLTDGEETCDGDSESVLRTLRASGLDIKMYIVGFALDDNSLVEQFKGWASLGGGQYYDAQNETELQTALHQAVTPRFEVKNSFGEVVLSGYIGEKKYTLLPGQYTISLPGYPAILAEEVKVLSGENTTHEFE